jgi:2-hydroxychromene-2-carboxylate isomerase
MSAPIIECFYTLSSPWMYFAAPRLRAMAERHGAKVRLRPFDFPEVVPATGGIPLRTRPQPRQDYHALELDRWRRHLDMPLNLRPKHYPPADQRPAGRMVMAAQAQGRAGYLGPALWGFSSDMSYPPGSPHEFFPGTPLEPPRAVMRYRTLIFCLSANPTSQHTLR